MAGQQQLKTLDQQEYYSRSKEELMKQANLYYIEKKFALDTEYDESKRKHAQLYEKILRSDNNEVISWINKKIRGALDDKNVEVVDIRTMQTKYRDINITNIYNTQVNDTWDGSVMW